VLDRGSDSLPEEMIRRCSTCRHSRIHDGSFGEVVFCHGGPPPAPIQGESTSLAVSWPSVEYDDRCRGWRPSLVKMVKELWYWADGAVWRLRSRIEEFAWLIWNS
jgi:hypothetical protein